MGLPALSFRRITSFFLVVLSAWCSKTGGDPGIVRLQISETSDFLSTLFLQVDWILPDFYGAPTPNPRLYLTEPTSYQL
jgi:hypothetical protein